MLKKAIMFGILLPYQMVRRQSNLYRYTKPKERIGQLNCLALCMRPDISHTVAYLSKFNNSCSEEHSLAAKRVISI